MIGGLKMGSALPRPTPIRKQSMLADGEQPYTVPKSFLEVTTILAAFPRVQ